MGQAPSYDDALSADSRSSKDEKSEKSTHTKKKSTRLTEFKQKLSKGLRSTKSSDHRKHVHDFLSTLSYGDLHQFVEGYRALDALKVLSDYCGLARKKGLSIVEDLTCLFENSYSSDMILEYEGVAFPVHKAILCNRCTYFANILSEHHDMKAPVHLKSESFQFPVDTFSSLLKYLYTGMSLDGKLKSILPQLSERFGTLNPVKDDMRNLLRTELFADVILEYPGSVSSSPSSNFDSSFGVFCNSDASYEVHCHSFILSARSGYFRTLLSMTKTMRTEGQTKLLLNEELLPQAYINIVLDCFYFDSINLSSVVKWKCADGKNGEPERLQTIYETAMELYEIGQFLEFPCLMQGCEDIVVKNFSTQSILAILEWSSQPYGSQWVYRQAMRFMCEQFQSLAKSNCFLANLPKDIFLEAVASDFLQVSEETVLSAVVKWGEWQVYKQQGSISTATLQGRSYKKKDIPNEALQTVLSDFIPHIRVQHILPANSSTLNSALQRGILKTSVPCDVVAPHNAATSRQRSAALYWRAGQPCPRLFPPYLQEAKKLLSETRVVAKDDYGQTTKIFQPMPDMLPSSNRSQGTLERKQSDFEERIAVESLNLDETLLCNIRKRERDLKSDKLVAKVLHEFPDKTRVMAEVQKRVMREFGLPDELAVGLFKTAPDLIEDSCSSSSSQSSRQGTLNKGTLNKGFVLTEEDAGATCMSHDKSQTIDIYDVNAAILNSSDEFLTTSIWSESLADSVPDFSESVLGDTSWILASVSGDSSASSSARNSIGKFTQV